MRHPSQAAFVMLVLLMHPFACAVGEEEDFEPHVEILQKIAEEVGCSLEEAHSKAVGTEFADPETCAVCHPRQYQEWLGSSHSYGAISPTFNSFEMVARRVLKGAVANNGALRNFCNKCHTPIGEELGEFTDYTDDSSVTPMRDSLSEVSAHGVSCDACHRVKELDTTLNEPLGKLGDGVANTSLILDTLTGMRRGPLTDPVANGFHSVSSNDYDFMTGDGLCAACHDVRIGHSTDAMTGE
ncbi:MAG: hypothetical protein KC931_23955, partial [Candidatus Omnitrophica bacterium]|nr:hypothetical protein [Candidatus Omnitrophota bacterium]